MKFAETFNATGKRAFDVDTTNFEFAKLDTIPHGEIVKLSGLYLHTGRFNTQPVAICAERKQLVNFPTYMCEVTQRILSNPEAVQSIRDGKVGFTTYEYVNETYNKKCTGIAFVDIE